MENRGTLLDKHSLPQLLEDIDTVLFDCDGVLWRSGTVIPGAAEAVERLQAIGKRIFFVSNNSTSSRGQYVSKFTNLGIPATKDQILSTSYAAAVYLESLQFSKKVYVIGEHGLFDEFKEFGISAFGLEHNHPFQWQWSELENLQVDKEVGAVVIGFDRHINYFKTCYAYLSLRENPECLFIATNTDSTFPSANKILPGGGTCVAPVATAINRQPLVLGKPEPFLLDVLKNKFHLKPERTLMVGDRLTTDILFAKRGGLKTLLVFSGVTHEEEYHSKSNDIIADYYAPSVSAFLETQ